MAIKQLDLLFFVQISILSNLFLSEPQMCINKKYVNRADTFLRFDGFCIIEEEPCINLYSDTFFLF